jgi:hypothetical protein
MASLKRHPGHCGAQDTFYVGDLKGVGRIYHRVLTDRGSEFCGNPERYEYATADGLFRVKTKEPNMTDSIGSTPMRPDRTIVLRLLSFSSAVPSSLRGSRHNL